MRICDTFCTSVTDATFPVEQGYAILSLFATFAAPGLLTRYSRIPEGTESYAYLRHILHFRLGHFHLRNLRPSNLMHICYTFPRRSFSDEFGDKFLGGFLPWSDFERRVVHTCLKFDRAGCSVHQLRFGSHAIIYFFRKQHIVRIGLTPTPFSSAPHVSRAESIWVPLPLFRGRRQWPQASRIRRRRAGPLGTNRSRPRRY